MERLDFREIANAKISSRLRQVLILILSIVIGMIISVTTNAQSHRSAHNSKARFRAQRNMYANACEIFGKKRMEKPKTLRLASAKKAKYKPMAEIDQPGTASRNSRMKKDVLVKREEVAQL